MKIKNTTIAWALGSALLCLCNFSSFEANAGYPKGYYDSLEGKCGAALMSAVKDVAIDHKVISYGDNTWKAFEVTDVKTVDGQKYWWDMYSNNLVLVSSGHSGLNIEHSVANSWWGKTKNEAYKDIVHLNPSDASANNRKSNYPLCELQSVTWDNGVTFVGKPKSGQGGGSSNGYEPKDEYKGDFARVFMYIFTVYNDISWTEKTAWMYTIGSDLMFQNWAQDLLLRWSANDPVSDKERNRNDGIYQQQLNRNPYIDLPDLADHIWGDKRNVPFHLEPGSDPEDPGTSDDDIVTYTWLGETETELSDGWTFEDIDVPSGLTIWKWKSYDKLYYLNASAFSNGTPLSAESYAWSPTVDLTNAETATFSFDHAAKYQTTGPDLCKVAVREVGSSDTGRIDIPVWPNPGSWTYKNSGDIDMKDFIGKKVRVGFLYKSNEQGADTWRIRNAKLSVTRKTTGVENVRGVDEDEDDSFLVEVWGNNIVVPEGAVIYDLNGRRCQGENLSRGIYIVTKPTFHKAVKVMVK